jgi:hypothetical protein
MILTNWQVDEAIATIVSAIAFVAGAVFVVFQMRAAARERYFSITAHLFEIWQSPDFQDDQLFLLHKLDATSWNEFVELGRGGRAERALHRVGGFYDRVGNLVLHKLISRDDILPTIGVYAITLWQRIEPLVREARLHENAVLFQNYEAMLPECRECYVPFQGAPEPAPTLADHVERIEPIEARRLVEEDRALIIDVSKTDNVDRIAGAIRAHPNDLTGWLAALTPKKSVVTYCT